MIKTVLDLISAKAHVTLETLGTKFPWASRSMQIP